MTLVSVENVSFLLVLAKKEKKRYFFIIISVFLHRWCKYNKTFRNLRFGSYEMEKKRRIRIRDTAKFHHNS